MAILKVDRDTITAQASNAISADSYSTGTQTTLNKTSGGNVDEDCLSYLIYAEITARPSSDAEIEVEMSHSSDATSWTDYVIVQRPFNCDEIEVESGSGTIYRFLGWIKDLDNYTKFRLKAIDYGFTAECIIETIYSTTEVT